MGFALLAFSSFSQPLNALARWLCAPACRTPRQDREAASGRPGRATQDRYAVSSAALGRPSCNRDGDGTDQPMARQKATEPLPFTDWGAAADGQPPSPALAPLTPLSRRFVVIRSRQERHDRPLPAGSATAAPASAREWSGTSANDGTAFAGCNRPRPTARPLRVLDRRGPGATARVMISGRMADVCAELDRLVRAEAAMQAPH